jgi:Putative DNA-binding domain
MYTRVGSAAAIGTAGSPGGRGAANLAAFHRSEATAVLDHIPSLSLRRLALADIDQQILEQLVAHGEDLLVECKRQLPETAKVAATVASFANTVGGWVLLGVDDEKKPVGYKPPPKLDLQSHLGQLLRNGLDPVPPFVAGLRDVGKVSIGVVRVFESDDVPVVLKGSGAIYVRDAGGKHPVSDHRTILELARRGAEARERAAARLVSQPLVNDALSPPDAEGVVNWLGARPAHTFRTVVRIAPLTVTPQLAEWPMSRLAALECGAAAAALVVGDAANDKVRTLPVEPYGRGVVGTAERSTRVFQREEAKVVADSAGVVGAVISRKSEHTNLVDLEQLVTRDVRPTIERLSIMLSFAEAYGSALCDLWLLVPGELPVYRAPRRASLIHVSGEFVIPADENEITALVERWRRELERTVGIDSFEPR